MKSMKMVNITVYNTTMVIESKKNKVDAANFYN